MNHQTISGDLPLWASILLLIIVTIYETIEWICEKLPFCRWQRG